MTTTLGQGRNPNFLSLMTAAILGLAVLAFAASPASAKDHGNGKHGRGNQGKGHQVQSGHYRVPQVITVEHRGDYRPYYSGRSYYAPHHHYHAAYRFPVWVNGVVAYRSYPYCDDHLFVTGAVALPQLAFNFTYARPGAYVSGYYGAPAPPSYYVYPQPVYVEPRGHRCHHDHGDYDRDWDDD
ncbi:MAG TPA: hypothetical protein VJV75_00880 [Candidatus Polarisedimenticolia bacterium]|nr:hypothetical protein [Candidatus Polarisedimenticolia bacterium]